MLSARLREVAHPEGMVSSRKTRFLALVPEPAAPLHLAVVLFERHQPRLQRVVGRQRLYQLRLPVLLLPLRGQLLPRAHGGSATSQRYQPATGTRQNRVVPSAGEHSLDHYAAPKAPAAVTNDKAGSCALSLRPLAARM